MTGWHGRNVKDISSKTKMGPTTMKVSRALSKLGTGYSPRDTTMATSSHWGIQGSGRGGQDEVERLVSSTPSKNVKTTNFQL